MFTLKREPKEEITRYKARWVILKCSQREELDYNETFALIVKPMSYKALFALAATLNWDLKQINVKIAFLYNAVKKLIYIYQLINFKSQKYPNKICKLNKVLYDLKQSPRVWYNIFAEFIKEQDFTPIDADYSMFTDPQTDIIIALYIDNVLITNSNRADIQRIKDALNVKFYIIDLRPYAYYLEMTVTRDRTNRTIRLKQAKYVKRVLRDNDMWNAKSVATLMKTIIKLKPVKNGYEATPKNKLRY